MHLPCLMRTRICSTQIHLDAVRDPFWSRRGQVGRPWYIARALAGTSGDTNPLRAWKPLGSDSVWVGVPNARIQFGAQASGCEFARQRQSSHRCDQQRERERATRFCARPAHSVRFAIAPRACSHTRSANWLCIWSLPSPCPASSAVPLPQVGAGVAAQRRGEGLPGGPCCARFSTVPLPGRSRSALLSSSRSVLLPCTKVARCLLPRSGGLASAHTLEEEMKYPLHTRGMLAACMRIFPVAQVQHYLRSR
jgi:hypothetical protein